jgi:hypothetical protein
MKIFKLIIYSINNIMSHIQLLCSFQKDKDLKLEIEMVATIAKNLWFNHIFDLYNIFV